MTPSKVKEREGEVREQAWRQELANAAREQFCDEMNPVLGQSHFSNEEITEFVAKWIETVEL